MSDYVTKIRTDKGDLPVDYNALANLPTTDTTLSVSGKSADAKSVGDALDNMSLKFSNPNLLINGDFQIWQRGESFSNIANKYTADRWKIKNAKGNTSLVERSTDIPSGEFLRQSVHIKETLEENTYLSYNFENALKGTFTLSFWYKTSSEFHSYIYDNSVLVHLGKLTTLNAWTKATFTFTATAMTFINVIHAMSAGDCYIAGVKLEYGDIATVLMPRLGAEELALCQRYYRNADFYFVPGVAGTTGREITFIGNMSMRVNPIINIVQVPTTLRTINSDSIATTLTYQSVYHGDNVLVVTFNSSAELGSKAVAWPTSHFVISVDAEIY